MITRLEQLPDDIAELKNIIAAKDEEIKILKEKNLLLNADKYGRKSEKRSPEDDTQARLFNEAETYVDSSVETEAEVQESEVRSHRRRKRGRRAIPADLPRIDIIHELPPEERVCDCGGKLVKCGEKKTERLDIVPPKVQVHRHIRYKYACSKCEETQTVSAYHFILKSIASAGLMAWLFVSKFCDALPFYRQEQMLKRIGIHFNRATMCNLAVKTAANCVDVKELLWEELLKSPVLYIDETPLQVLKKPGIEQGKSPPLSHMWIFRGGTRENPIIIYEYRDTRSGKFLEERLLNYKGVIMTDDFVGYRILNEMPEVTHVNCWAHARRKFTEADKTAEGSPTASRMLDLIGKLYFVEKQAREQKLEPAQILELRQKKSRPIIEEIRNLLEHNIHAVPPKLQLGKAFRYMSRIWDRLTLFLEDGCIPLDNNPAENSVRPFVIGRKNWLFNDTVRGAEAGAFLYTIIQTAKENGLDPFSYLKFLFGLHPRVEHKEQLREILPHQVEADDIREFLDSSPGF